MNCASMKEVSIWVVYDAKIKVFKDYSPSELRELMKDTPVKMVDKRLWNPEKGKKVWVDVIINSAFFK